MIRSRMRWLIPIAVFFFLAPAFFWILLQTSLGGQFLLFVSGRFLAPLVGAEIHYSEAHFIPLHSLVVKDLKLKWALSLQQRLEIEIPSLETFYNIQILHPKVTTLSALIEKPRIHVHWTVLPSTAPETPTDLEAILEQLKNPPVEIDFRNLKITQAAGDFLLATNPSDSSTDTKPSSAASLTQVRAPEIEATGSLSLSPGDLSVQMDLAISDKNPTTTSIQVSSPENPAELTLQATGAVRVNSHLFYKNDWQLDFSTGSTFLELQKFRMNQGPPAHSIRAQVDKIRATFGSKIQIRPERFCSLENALEPGKEPIARIHAEIESSPVFLFLDAPDRHQSNDRPDLVASAHKWRMEASRTHPTAKAPYIAAAKLSVENLKFSNSTWAAAVPMDTDWEIHLDKACQGGKLNGNLRLFNQMILSSFNQWSKTQSGRSFSDSTPGASSDVISGSISGHTELHVTQSVANLLPSVPWKMMGLPQGRLQIQGALSQNHKSLQAQAEFKQDWSLGQLPDAVVLSPMTLKTTLKSQPDSQQAHNSQLPDQWTGEFQTQIVRAPQLKKKGTLLLNWDFLNRFFSKDFTTLSGSLNVILDDQPLAENQIKYQSPTWTTQSKLSLSPLAQLFLAPNLLNLAGELDASLVTQGDLTKGAKIEVSLSRSPNPPLPEGLKLLGPLQIKTEFSDLNSPPKAQIEIVMPSWELPKQIKWSSVPLQINTQTLPSGLKIQGQLGENSLELPTEAGASHRLRGLVGIFEITLPTNGTPVLNRLNFDLAEGAIEIIGRTFFDKSGRTSAELNLQTQIPGHWPAFYFGKLSGGLTSRIVLAQQSANLASLEARTEFRNLSVSLSAITLEGLQGEVPISELLRKRQAGWSFASLEKINPFEFAEFSSFQPITRPFRPFRIQKIQFHEKSYGPLTTYASINQNLVEARGIQLELPGGHVVGDFLFNFNPENRSAGFSAKASGVILRNLVPKALSAGSEMSDEPITGQMGATVSLEKKELNGRFDISQVGSSQMISMINFVDPYYENEKLSAARTALTLAYPTAVLGRIQNGFMDLNLTLGGLAPKTYQVKTIPVSAMVVSTFDRFGIH